MCGITGIVGPTELHDRIEAMTRTLTHRGPDDTGVWRGRGVSLGHTRLSILDLSDAGHQPMQLGPHHLVYNGEIYNFEELRRDLPGPFVSDGDTEVLLHLFAKDGFDALPSLRGMFAFAVWNEESRTLFAARDPVGIKPLYYRELPGGALAFASEAKALIALGGVTFDRQAVQDYFGYKRVPAPKTIHREIRQLPPGHHLVWDGRLTVERYWDPSLEATLDDPQRATERLGELLREIVPQQVRADVPVGLFLSGGIDSTTVLAHLDHATTFTLGQDVARRSEHLHARRIAEHFGSDHHEEIARAVDLDQALDTLPGVYDEPFGDSAAWSVYLVSEMARRRVTVALSGEGGDEMFCGYDRYSKWFTDRASRFHQLVRRFRRPFGRGARSAQRRTAVGLERYAAYLSPFTLQQRRTLLHPSLADPDYDPLWRLRPFWREDLDPLRRLQWLDLNTELPEVLLTKVDRASMAHSLEVRPPLLDHHLVEFSLSVEARLHRDVPGQRGKLIVRRLIEERVPEGFLDYPKRGFNLPIRTWTQNDPGRLERALDRLAGAELIVRPRRPAFSNEQTWMLLILDSWLERTGEYR